MSLTRRQALGLLTSIPAIADVKVAALKPDDVLIVEADGPMSSATADRIKAVVGEVFPGRKVLVFEGGVRLSVLRADIATAIASSTPNLTK